MVASRKKYQINVRFFMIFFEVPITSAVRKYFVKSDNTSRCKLCGAEVKTCGNTTNMYFHIRRKHRDVKLSSEKKTKNIQKKMENQSEESDYDQPMPSPSNSSCSSTTMKKIVNYLDACVPSPSSDTVVTTVAVKKSSNKQLKLDAAFALQKSFQDGGSKANDITNGILFFIAKNNLPFDIVESEGFLVLMQKIIPLYKVPSRRTITRLIEDRYDALSTIVKEDLAEIDDICLTTDVWTESNNTKSFLGLTAHYLVQENHKSVTIGVEELTDRHTADYLEKKLIELIAKWNIKKESIVAVVSDSAANIKKAITDSFGVDKQLPCFAHLLNLVPSKIIDSDEIISPLIIKVKNIVTFFKKSVVAADKLRSISDLKLIQSVETRWNSCYEMLQRIVLLADKISVILLQIPTGPEMLTASELLIVNEFIQLLLPFFEATQIISQEKYFTGSKTIPVVKTIKNKLKEFTTTTESGTKLKIRLLDEFCKRFENIEQICILNTATLLDPRFKNIHFENHLAYSNNVRKLVRILNSDEHSDSKDQPTHSSNTDEKNFWSFHETVVSSSKSKRVQSHVSNEMPEDLRYYLHQDVSEMNINPIAFWNHYPQSLLSKIAKRYLTVMATSVPSERLFSRAGNIMVDNRNKLSSSHLQQLLFLNSLTLKEWKI